MATKDDGGPAFPGEKSADADLVRSIRDETGLGLQDVKRLLSKHGGMSLRDWFAGQALATALAEVYDANAVGECSFDALAAAAASAAFAVADAMLAERAKGGA